MQTQCIQRLYVIQYRSTTSRVVFIIPQKSRVYMSVRQSGRKSPPLLLAGEEGILLRVSRSLFMTSAYLYHMYVFDISSPAQTGGC